MEGIAKMTSTRTIDALLEIITDPDMMTRRRIEAAEAVLGFEAPEAAVLRAREYLIEVFENREEDIADRMDALKASRKAEAAKVNPKIVHLTRRTQMDRREAWRTYERWKRKRHLTKVTRMAPLPGWDDDLLADSYLPPPGDDWPPTNVVYQKGQGFKILHDR
jgi:hypothetical protein